jgi:MerR family transcriptional regulator, redox-sensitive transcriptional activator SoxR
MFTVGEAAEEVGLATSALRYYDRIGLVPVTRTDSGRRLYNAAAMHRLRIVGVCQAAGFTLDEIRELLDGSTQPGAWRALAEQKRVELSDRIARLDAARDLVDEALDCDCAHLESCGRMAHGSGAVGRDPVGRDPLRT